MTDVFASREWLSVSDLVEILNLAPSRVHRLLEDKQLLGTKRDRVLSVPRDFLMDDEPLVHLRGTLFLLEDAGFTNDEAMEWLLTKDEVLGAAPIDALRSGRKTEVRRIAQALA